MALAWSVLMTIYILYKHSEASEKRCSISQGQFNYLSAPTLLANGSSMVSSHLGGLQQTAHHIIQSFAICEACTKVQRVAHGRSLGSTDSQILQLVRVQTNALSMLLNVVQPGVLHTP